MRQVKIAGLALLAVCLLLPGAANASSASFARTDFDASGLGSIQTDIFDLALGAASCAVKTGAVSDPKTLTVIDYSKPSTERRLWVFDLTTRELIYQELVAHGQGSGENLASQFSNDSDSHRTSLGLFKTADTYVGKNGSSLRLDGLDKGVNDKARDRAIVMHGAPYVSATFVRTNGRLGRSWGCPAVSAEVARDMIDRVKGGTGLRLLPGCELAEDFKISRRLSGLKAVIRRTDRRRLCRSSHQGRRAHWRRCVCRVLVAIRSTVSRPRNPAARAC